MVHKTKIKCINQGTCIDQLKLRLYFQNAKKSDFWLQSPLTSVFFYCSQWHTRSKAFYKCTPGPRRLVWYPTFPKTQNSIWGRRTFGYGTKPQELHALSWKIQFLSFFLQITWSVENKTLLHKRGFQLPGCELSISSLILFYVSVI